MSNLILNFSHVYPADAGNKENGLCRVDLSDIPGTDMYCTPEAAEEIRRRLSFCGPDGIHFIDSGNYHYVTGFFLEKIPSPFSLVLFGECSLSEPFPQLLEDERINRATNRILYHFLSGYLPVRNS